MRELKSVMVEGQPLLRYFDGRSYYRVPKEDLIALVFKDALFALSNADIQAELQRRWQIDMTSTHIRYHLRLLIARGVIEQVGRGLYQSKQEDIFQ